MLVKKIQYTLWARLVDGEKEFVIQTLDYAELKKARKALFNTQAWKDKKYKGASEEHRECTVWVSED